MPAAEQARAARCVPRVCLSSREIDGERLASMRLIDDERLTSMRLIDIERLTSMRLIDDERLTFDAFD